MRPQSPVISLRKYTLNELLPGSFHVPCMHWVRDCPLFSHQETRVIWDHAGNQSSSQAEIIMDLIGYCQPPRLSPPHLGPVPKGWLTWSLSKEKKEEVETGGNGRRNREIIPETERPVWSICSEVQSKSFRKRTRYQLRHLSSPPCRLSPIPSHKHEDPSHLW